MSTSAKTLRQLKEFLNTLSEDQLDQTIKIAETDRPIKRIAIFDVLQEDYINPSGECAEPKSYYMPGGEFYDPAEDYSDEPICAEKGDVFFHIAE